MKGLITLTLFLLIITTGCSLNTPVADNENSLQNSNLSFNQTDANTTNQSNQMSTQNQDQNVGTPAEQNQETTGANQDQTEKLALIKTSMGDIKIKLDAKDAPISVANFEKYVSDKFYDGTIFHRVMDGFMIQGGGFDTKGVQKETNTPIKNEAKNGLSNKRGTVAMARTMVVDSATSQFYINLVDNVALNYRDDTNYGYAVFGEVVEGMDVVDKIAKVQTGDHEMFQDWPVDNVVINSIEMVK
jgi:peptidyl-prolyl cis-trans isomerase B (cyclophilin B)